MTAEKNTRKETPEPGILRYHGTLNTVPRGPEQQDELHVGGKIWNTSSKPILLRRIIVTVKAHDSEGLDFFATEQATRPVLSEGFELLGACAAKDIGPTIHRLIDRGRGVKAKLEYVKENTKAEITVEWCSEGKDHSQVFQIPDAEPA